LGENMKKEILFITGNEKKAEEVKERVEEE
jgi:hypothetical protein